MIDNYTYIYFLTLPTEEPTSKGNAVVMSRKNLVSRIIIREGKAGLLEETVISRTGTKNL